MLHLHHQLAQPVKKNDDETHFNGIALLDDLYAIVPQSD